MIFPTLTSTNVNVPLSCSRHTDAGAALGVELGEATMTVSAASTVLLVHQVALTRLEQHALAHQTRTHCLVACMRAGHAC